MTQQYLILFFISIITTSVGKSCDCLMTPIHWHVLDAYDIITVEAVERTDTISEYERDIIRMKLEIDTNSSQNVKLRIDSSMKMKINKQFIFIKGNTNCDRRFKIGMKYILFMSNDSTVMSCSYSSKLDTESSDYKNIIKYLSMNQIELQKTVKEEEKQHIIWYKKQLKKNKKKNNY